MLKSYFEKQFRAFEAATGVTADWMRDLYRTSKPAFYKFTLFQRFMAQHHGGLPDDARAVAGIAAIKQEDCGPCLQIVVRFAEAARVDTAIIRAAVAGDVSALPAPLDAVYRFAAGVAAADFSAESEREALETIYDRATMTDLAFVIGSTRVFPTLKRALGYAQACFPLEIGGRMVPVGHGEAQNEHSSAVHAVA